MRATVSKAGLLSACQFWARAGVEWFDATSEAADRGNRFHAAIALWVSFRTLPTMDDDIAQLVAIAQRWLDGHRDMLTMRAEVAFAWDPATDEAEEIGVNLGRDYSKGNGRFCGSADLVWVDMENRRGYVGDWATGNGEGKGPQLRALAMMLARTYRLDSVDVEALEVSADGVRVVCRETLDSFALAAVAGELADGLGAIATAEAQPGPHCGEMYCPARATCPAVTAIVEQVIPVDALVRHKWGVTIANAEHAAWLYDQAKAVESAAKLVKEAVKAYVPVEGLALEDGSTLIEGTRQMPRFDKDRMVSLARTLGATDEQIESCTRVVTEGAGLKRVGGASKPAKVRKRKAA